jgi:hypothetical protein
MSDTALETTGRPEEVAAASAEAEKVQAAKAELYDEMSEAPSDSLSTDELILGKYKSTDELASAYTNLQKEYSRLKNGEQAVESDSVPEPEAPVEQAQAEAPADTGSELSDEAIATITRGVFEQAGGEAKYEQLVRWASNSLDAERVNAYNQALEQGDMPAIINQLKGMQFDYMQQNGYEPRLTAGRAPAQDVKAFSSRYQVEQAINDPRYQADAGYRQDVERRIAATPNELFGL